MKRDDGGDVVDTCLASQRMAQEAGARSVRIITYNFDRPQHAIPDDKCAVSVRATRVD